MMHLKKIEWFILIGLLLLSLIPSIGGVFRLVELGSGSGPEFLPKNPRIQMAPTPLVFHLLSVVPYCILGAFNFFQALEKSI